MSYLPCSLTRIFAFSLCLLLGACATTKNATQGNLSRSEHVQHLSKVKAWQIRGSIGVRRPDKSWTAAMRWRQTNEYFDVYLNGPFGAGAVTIRGNRHHAVLKTSDNKSASASSAQQLLRQQTGMNVPVEHALYWIRGLTVPGQPARKLFDSKNHLNSLVQSGWTINYLKYKKVDALDLPTKIIMTHGGWVVKIVIRSWQVK